MEDEKQYNPLSWGTAKEYLKKYKWVVGGAALVIVLIVGVSIAQWRKSVQNEGEAIQERVEQVYQNAQSSLSACLDQGKVAAQVADAEFERLKELLTDVISARYVDENGNATSASEALGGGALFSVVNERYPEVSQASFQNLQDVVVGCRDEFQGAQDRVFNEARELDDWVQKDSFWNQGIKNDFPSNSLETINYSTGQTIRGKEALAYMTRVISTKDARETYESGELVDQDLFGGDD